MYIHSTRIYTPEGCINGILAIQNGRIQQILPESANVPIDFDAQHLRILPGIIDTHNHGTMGFSLMGVSEDPDQIVRGYLKGLAAQGVTACFPTTNPSFFEAIVRSTEARISGAMPIGIHSEGPYLNRVGENGIDVGHPEIDLSLLKAMVEKGKGMLRLVALAPELPHAEEAIRYLNSQGVYCAFAHSNCDYDQAREAFTWGIQVSTHTANVMSGIHHRHMGGLGACMLDDHLYNEIICDGLHVSNEMLELMFRMKHDAQHKFIMVSDNVALAGAPIGKYRLDMGDNEVLQVNIDARGFCLSETGRLCGSTLPVLYGMKNLAQGLHMPLEQIILMSSVNPARLYGEVHKGYLASGMDADFIVVDDDFQLIRTYVMGECVYDKEKEHVIFNEEYVTANRISA